ncbi:hypothetical protein B0H11DRAFT_611529 [Mycena galericulata]|nr:hypothetical protein B0H11DRAFT_611529 [Mycena galericulata]
MSIISRNALDSDTVPPLQGLKRVCYTPMSPPSFYRDPPSLPVARTPFQKSASIPKAPIVNPYEKFTQPQFDAWIGDITGALRGALGYRAETPPKPKTRTQWHIPARSSEAPDATSTGRRC